ncbi:MAG: hypothetical protein CL845_09785 [Crocinitomicaceae bacterium]|jgi:hypothetical protein|nr:hypothetical protein [Crocinitomicaceae bacterium]
MYYLFMGLGMVGYAYAINEVMPASLHPSGRADGKYPGWLFWAVAFIPIPFALIFPLFKRF